MSDTDEKPLFGEIPQDLFKALMDAYWARIEPQQNTDREVWRGPDDGNDAYADSVHITADGGLGINVGGLVIVLPVREWHALARDRGAVKC